MKTSQKILQYIAKNGQASGKELADYLGDITPRAVRKQLKRLLDSGELKKIGHPPKVFYFLVPEVATSILDGKITIINTATSHGDILAVDEKIRQIIEQRYLFITPSGEMKSGWEGFALWCKKTKQDPLKTAREYIATLGKYDAYAKGGLLNGMDKMKGTFHDVFLDRLFYLDFYSIERFGKTKIGQILLHAKNSQDRKLMHNLVDQIHPRITALVEKYAIDGILFIPPTVKREIQFMKELEKYLKLPMKALSVTKVKTQVMVAQKTLSRLEDRVENAKRTIVVEDTGMYKNILLIDDAVGSGATLNETAAQIRKKGLCRGKIIGLAIAGSFNGFDVISEV